LSKKSFASGGEAERRIWTLLEPGCLSAGGSAAAAGGGSAAGTGGGSLANVRHRKRKRSIAAAPPSQGR
jgi:hypothetical protein